MKNLLLLSDEPTDQCSFYRLWPFAELRNNVHLTVMRTTEFDAYHVLNADAVFLLRPHSDAHVSIMSTARTMGRPVWIDYDDDFLSLEPHHAWAERFGSFPQRKNFEQIAALASHVSVTTRAIAESWFKVSPVQVQIIPNAFNDSMYALPPSHNADSKVIVWRGSYSHVRDLEIIEELIPSMPDYKFVFMGAFHWTMPKRFPTATFYPFMPMAAYFQTLKTLKPRAFIVPLQDTAFNRSKSNCVWLEATHAGAVVVASALPEFDQKGILQVPPGASWPEAVKHATICGNALFGRAVTSIRESFVLSVVNKAREATLSYVCERG